MEETERGIVQVLAQFNVDRAALVSYATNSLPSADTIKGDTYKFYVLAVCDCGVGDAHLTVKHLKRLNISFSPFTFDFNGVSVILASGGTFDQMVLTHIIISILKVHEKKWMKRTDNAEAKCHRLGRIVQLYAPELLTVLPEELLNRQVSKY